MADGSTVQFSLTSSAFPGETLVVDGFEATEALDEPFRARVRVSTKRWDDDREVSTYLGADCVVEITRAGDGWVPRRFCGIVERVWQTDPGHGHGFVVLDVVPALAYLAKGRDSRVFQDKTVPEILEAVLSEGLAPYGREVKLELEGTYERREHCLQYQESDFELVSRLMQEVGIHYGFDHEGDVERLILRDTNRAFPALASGELVSFVTHNLVLGATEPVLTFQRDHRVTSTSVVVRDWDWTAGSAAAMSIEAESRAQGIDGVDREVYEHGRARSLTLSSFDEGVKRYQSHDASERAGQRAEAFKHRALPGVGTSRVIGFSPGMTFELSGHPYVGVDGRYVLTRVRHVDAPAPETADRSDPYHNVFECIPVDTPHRPARRALKPSIPGSQTAVVTGPAGEEVHVDAHGRIRVQMHWDREGGHDEKSSMWIRVRQPWAGASWGHWWVPRIGMEVVVQFIDGDPDRPLVTGSVFNASNPLPYPQPDEKTKSTIKSNSSLGGGGFNEIRFEDKAGNEEIFVHAQKDYNEVVENNHTTHVGNNQTNTVEVDQRQTIHQNQSERVDGNQSMTVGGNRTVQVTGNFDETVDGTETRHTAGDVTESFDANETRDIGASITEDVGGNETRDVSADQTESIGAAHTLTVSGDATYQIGAAFDLTANGGITTITPAAFDVTATGGQTIKADGGITVIAPGGITITAPGGVHRIDLNWITVCGENLVVGLNQTEVTGLKGSITMVLSNCFNGMKAEDTIFEMAGCGVDMVQEGTLVGLRTIKLESDGVAWQNGFKIKA
jgi:type VI secretion system secreted protein VgrG